MKTFLRALGVASVLTAILCASLFGGAECIILSCLLGGMSFSLGMCIED